MYDWTSWNIKSDSQYWLPTSEKTSLYRSNLSIGSWKRGLLGYRKNGNIGTMVLLDKYLLICQILYYFSLSEKYPKKLVKSIQEKFAMMFKNNIPNWKLKVNVNTYREKRALRKEFDPKKPSNQSSKKSVARPKLIRCQFPLPKVTI